MLRLRCRRAGLTVDPTLSTGAFLRIEPAIRAALAKPRARPLVVGICGSQASGKSTVSAQLVARFCEQGIQAAALSLDDVYLTRAERSTLARTVHPLLQTRGVPGTHDVGLALSVFEALDSGRGGALPRFDKAQDDRAPEAAWGVLRPDTQLLILEGWCVGALPQAAAALVEPVNALEEDEDADRHWRRYVNAALAGDYQCLFARLDMLVLLAAPGFSVVRDWRIEQEQGLARTAQAGATALMSVPQIERFILHYQRLTMHILAEMPGRADLVVRLASDRSVL